VPAAAGARLAGHSVPAVAYGLQLRAIADRWRADIVHSNALKMHLLSALTVRRRRLLVWHLRDLLATPYMSETSATLVRSLARIVPDVTICVSAATRHAFNGNANGRASHATYTIFDGVPPDADERYVAEAKVRPRRVLMLGRIAEWKGQHVFIRAAERLCAAGHDEEFVIAGGATNPADAAYEALIRRMVEERRLSGRVVFAGVVEDVADLLRSTDVLVHCSTSPEPFGLVILEAMGFGVPVIAANAGGPAEIIRDGIDGRLYPPGDDQTLAAILHELLQNSVARQELGDNGLRVVHDRFALSRTADELTELYRRHRRTPVAAKTKNP
jgi:glycosyltransferase involved in cell wall biosynthesis